ncbi:hypothetical protein CRI45_01720 [Salmonella enterica]|nr:hypothetical protein [Salmonella enterica]
MHAKKLLAHKFDPFPAVTLSEFCLFAPAILHTITPRQPFPTVPVLITGFFPDDGQFSCAALRWHGLKN